MSDYRWKEYVPGVWTGVIGNAVWQLKQTDSELFYRVYRETSLTQEKKAQGCVKSEVKEENDVDTKLTGKIVKKIFLCIEFNLVHRLENKMSQ